MDIIYRMVIAHSYNKEPVPDRISYLTPDIIDHHHPAI
jgi:hypothetical protein